MVKEFIIFVTIILFLSTAFLVVYLYRFFHVVGKSMVPDKHPYFSTKFLKIMKQLTSLLKLLLIPVLGFLFPELADPGVVYEYAATFVGLAVLVTIFVQAIKVAIKYDPDVSWKYLPILLALLIGALVGLVFYWLNLGLFATFETIPSVIVGGLMVGGLSLGWYDAPFIKHWLGVLFNMELHGEGDKIQIS